MNNMRHSGVAGQVRAALRGVFVGVEQSLHHTEAERIRREIRTTPPDAALARDWDALAGDMRRAVERQQASVERQQTGADRR